MSGGRARRGMETLGPQAIERGRRCEARGAALVEQIHHCCLGCLCRGWCAHVHVRVYCAHVHVHVRVYAQVPVCMCVWSCLCACACKYARVHNVCAYKYTYLSTCESNTKGTCPCARVRARAFVLGWVTQRSERARVRTQVHSHTASHTQNFRRCTHTHHHRVNPTLTHI